jgi:hypothetical protein
MKGDDSGGHHVLKMLNNYMQQVAGDVSELQFASVSVTLSCL